jgi:hypothetical protein
MHWDIMAAWFNNLIFATFKADTELGAPYLAADSPVAVVCPVAVYVAVFSLIYAPFGLFVEH